MWAGALAFGILLIVIVSGAVWMKIQVRTDALSRPMMFLSLPILPALLLAIPCLIAVLLLFPILELSPVRYPASLIVSGLIFSLLAVAALYAQSVVKK